MAVCNINGIDVKFPFEPYELQKNYMEKVIECLQNQQNGILESPTGTGKTLSLLCASLAWLEIKKAQIQAQRVMTFGDENSFLKEINENLAAGGGVQNGRGLLGMPTIIYASRTHSQLYQAMQELKRTEYKHMKAYVLASREQTCVHPELKSEPNNTIKNNMCRLKLKEKSCSYYNKVDRKKDDPAITDLSVIDIEDIVKLGEAHKFCPYYMAKELKQRADIVFVPYNYILDPRARKALGVDLSSNSIVIFDEAHNIDKVCEDSASLQIKTTDITLCIDEVTAVMKAITDDVPTDFNDKQVDRDFSPEELCVLKQMFLDFEKVLDEVPLKKVSPEDTNFEGTYIFVLLEKAGITQGNSKDIINLIDKLIQFLTVVKIGDGPFQRKGNGLQLFSDLLLVAFASATEKFTEKLRRCYKVHITVEESFKKNMNNWLSKATVKANCRILSFWCFSPGFGMNMLMDQGLHSVILTSGTLAPLKPLISELELNVAVQLENPHIVKGDQVCVKIMTKGPDNEVLNAGFQNRDNPKYITSLGRTILNLVRIIPGGVLIFFPSYPIMLKCQLFWQETGIWGGICQLKPIYVEPRDKISFNTAMSEYYGKINDPNYKGAIFMGVCRGKVSEGLDFADINGRAVFITGLPYPPLKDPKVILKQRYLDICHSRDKEYLKGGEWYCLEATRAVNQAIGRVIRHRYDYGAIILLDSRFANQRIINNMSRWLRNHIKVVKQFGEIVRDLRNFFQYAQERFPVADSKVKLEKENIAVPAEFEIPRAYQKTNIAKDSSSLSQNLPGSSDSSGCGLVTLHKREPDNPLKRKRFTVVQNPRNEIPPGISHKEFINMVQKAMDGAGFKLLIAALNQYKGALDIKELLGALDHIFSTRCSSRYVVRGLETYIKQHHRAEFATYCDTLM